jgi:hypothetical protein
LVSFLGALVIEPRLEASVMEPFCKKTRSPSFTAITSAFALPQTMDGGHDELAVLGLVLKVGHLAIRDQTDALGFEPGLQREDQGVILVVDGSLDARERFNAGKLEHEAVQVTLELNGAVPGLEGEGGGPHNQNSVSKNPGESQSVMQLAPNASSSARLSFSNSIRSCMENPIEVTGTFARRLSTSLASECDLCCSLNSTVSSNTVLPALFSEGIDL